MDTAVKDQIAQSVALAVVGDVERGAWPSRVTTVGPSARSFATRGHAQSGALRPCAMAPKRPASI